MSNSTDLLGEIDHLFKDKISGYVRASSPSVIQGVYLFQVLDAITPSKPPIFWTIDFKRGQVLRGQPPTGVVPDVTYVIKDSDLVELLRGTLNSVQAYLSGRIKITGNSAAAFKFQRFMIECRALEEKQQESTMAKTKNSESPNIPADGLKSDVIFELLRSRLSHEPELFRTILFLVQVNLTRDGQPVASWTIDTKSPGGKIYRNAADNGKPEASVTVEDEDYIKILFGKLNPQRAFMTGKMKVKGNLMLLQRLDRFWNQVQTTRRDPEYPFVKDILLSSNLKSGLRSEVTFFDLVQRLVRQPQVVPPETNLRMNITKNGDRKISWMISFDEQAKLAKIKHTVVEGQKVMIGKPDLDLTLEDDVLVRLIRDPTYKLQQAIEQKQVKCEGKTDLVPRVAKLFEPNPKLGLKAKL